jgi:hypothetical protein
MARGRGIKLPLKEMGKVVVLYSTRERKTGYL